MDLGSIIRNIKVQCRLAIYGIVQGPIYFKLTVHHQVYIMLYQNYKEKSNKSDFRALLTCQLLS